MWVGKDILMRVKYGLFKWDWDQSEYCSEGEY